MYRCDDCLEDIDEPTVRQEVQERAAGKPTIYAPIISCPECGSYNIHLADTIEDDLAAIVRMTEI